MKVCINGIYIDPSRVESVSRASGPYYKSVITMKSGKEHSVRSYPSEVRKALKGNRY
jgi:hypothetical protein